MKAFKVLAVMLAVFVNSIQAQKSDIGMKESDKNGISVQQTDTSHSKIELDNSDNNTIEVTQKSTDKSLQKDKISFAWLEDSDHFLAAVLSLISIVVLGWKGFKMLRKKKSKQQ